MTTYRAVVRVDGQAYGWTCDEHAAIVPPAGECPGPAFDVKLARSVSVRTAYAFGDWPPADPRQAAEDAGDPLLARQLDGDR